MTHQTYILTLYNPRLYPNGKSHCKHFSRAWLDIDANLRTLNTSGIILLYICFQWFNVLRSEQLWAFTLMYWGNFKLWKPIFYEAIELFTWTSWGDHSVLVGTTEIPPERGTWPGKSREQTISSFVLNILKIQTHQDFDWKNLHFSSIVCLRTGHAEPVWGDFSFK